MEAICIIMVRNDGALQRILGLIERRGFIVEGVAMQPGTGVTAHLFVHVRGRDESRRLDILIRQIDRLFDVQRVTGASEGALAPGQPASPSQDDRTCGPVSFPARENPFVPVGGTP